MRFGLLVSTLAALGCGITAAQATVQVAIDLSHQRMHVSSSQGSYDWPISSARSGFSTPGGSYAPTHLELMHYSHKYNMSPMPHAIFFRGGYAIHGSYATGALGRPASHGCIRLAPGNATTLYNLVKSEGARIGISGTPPASAPFYARGDGGRAHVQRAAYGQTNGDDGNPGGGGYAGYAPYGYAGYAPYGYGGYAPFGD